MKDVGFLVELGIVIGAALAGGLLARLLKLPVLVGYLAAGVAIGPHTPGLIAEQEVVGRVANVGIALLMFAVGVQFSLRELQGVRDIALRTSAVQILGSLALGILIGAALGWGVPSGLVLGGALAMSSTAVMMRILEERGELGSSHGAVMLGILLIQDLSLILFIALLPALSILGNEGVGALGQVGLSLLVGGIAVVSTLYLATQIIPRMLDKVAGTGSSELFLLTTIALCFGAAIAAHLAGLGMALGAFLAGIVVSGSPYAHEMFSQVRPLRDVFASIFFVSIGMLVDPGFIARSWPAIALVALAILLVKPLLVLAGVAWSGGHARTALLVALGLAQIGEFSFVLASEGQRHGIAAPGVRDTIISAAVITIFATPFAYGSAPRLYRLLARFPPFLALIHRESVKEPKVHRRRAYRAIVLGGGRVGRYTSAAFRRLDVSHLVVDYDSEAIETAQRFNVPVLYGDATSPMLLQKTHPEKAELAVVALTDVAATEMAVRALRNLAPRLPIVARVRRGEDMLRLKEAGATFVVHGEFEAGVATIRECLDRLGFYEDQIDSYIEHVRARRYRRLFDAPDATEDTESAQQ